MKNQELLEQFNKIYHSLNEQQKLAVDTIEGPVMVIAGPGTGKTQILSARIGNILLKTDAQPGNILCLTYTDAGVVAMRKRLKSFIGADAYKVNLNTFHSFCNEIIQANLSYFEKTALDPVSDLESIEIIKELIDGLKNGNPLKRYRGDVYFETGNLRALFSAMKREGWTAALIEEKIDEFIELVRDCEDDSPYFAEYKYKRKTKDKLPGDLKPAFEILIERMEKLRAAVNEFDNYQALMRSRNRYDFDDMINWVIRAFEENPLLLNQYQEQYLYILVDEYQDTSGTQNALVQLLINYWDRPNVFVVGDDDQSIYRFQGANLENMVQFADSLKEGIHTVVLTSNYRSVQPVLDISKILIEHNLERLVNKIPNLSKQLTASNELISHLDTQPQLRQYRTQREEMTGITLEIEKLINSGVQPGSIAVIYKEHKYGEALARFLQARSLPYYSRKSENAFDLALGKKLLQLLRYLYAEHDSPYGGDEMLFEILHFDCFNIKPIEIAMLSIEVANRQFGKDKTSIRKLLYERAHQHIGDLFAQNTTLLSASDAIESLIADVANVSLQKLFENILTRTGILGKILESPDKHRQLKIVTALFDFIKEETSRNPSLTLAQLVTVIDLMKREKLSVPIIEINGTDAGVNLLTAHGSKGLEFTYVFFAGCVAKSWEKKIKPNRGFAFPDTLFVSVSKEKETEELRRLFYVALTRAGQHLFISYYKFNEKNKEEVPTQFIAEIQSGGELLTENICTITDKDLEEFQLIDVIEQQRPEIEKIEANIIDRLLENFSLSVTAVNNILKCPLSFYFNQVLRIPAAKNEAMAFGSAVHYALEKLFTRMKENKDTFPSKEVFLGDFGWFMKRNRGAFVEEAFARQMERGQNVLNAYYDKYIDEWNKVVVVERMIKNVVVNGVPIKGKLDKLEFDGTSVNVVDYKTGDFENATDKLRPPDMDKYNKIIEKEHDAEKAKKYRLGGDYWRQAVFYKILLDNYAVKDWQVVSTEFDFIEPDNKNQYHTAKIVISPQDIEIVKAQITEVWQLIQRRAFYTGCGKEDCPYCNFVKDNRLYTALHELNAEENLETG